MSTPRRILPALRLIQDKMIETGIIARFQEALERALDPIPLGRILGYRTARLSPSEAVVGLDTTTDHYNPMGTVHGGVITAIADTAMGIAHGGSLQPGETTTTLELKINFLRPVFISRLYAHGKVTKSGRTISLVECDVVDRDGRLVAKASSTCMTLRGKQAEGREIRRTG